MAAIMNQYISHPNQLYGIRRVEIVEGTAKGTTVFEVHTAGGLQVDILPDTGLDIGNVRFNGKNMSYISKNGNVSKERFLPFENEFIRSFPGGMLYTCGLRNTGPSNRDNDEWHPLHGRFHSLSASELCASVEGENIVVKGVIRESALFGHLLQLKRTISIPIYGSSIDISDEISNLTPNDEEFMLLYHFNFGYPMLSENAMLMLPEKRKTTPRTEYAQVGLGKENVFSKPIDNEEEQVFFHQEMEQGIVYLQNPDINVKASLTWDLLTLPILAEWKSMASGDYVLGLEPTNSFIMGRSVERENNTLPIIKSGENIKTNLQLNFEII